MTIQDQPQRPSSLPGLLEITGPRCSQDAARTQCLAPQPLRPRMRAAIDEARAIRSRIAGTDFYASISKVDAYALMRMTDGAIEWRLGAGTLFIG